MNFLNPDRALQGIMRSYVSRTGSRFARGRAQEVWSPGHSLKLLMAGYIGTRNTGADVRVEEMVRQIRHVLGSEQVEFTMCTLDPKNSRGYFGNAQQVFTPQVFPRFLFEECPKYHGVVACEGSMFKSKFADALSTFMAGALGMAAAEKKLSVGYGAEAGAMNPPLKKFVEKNCRDSFVICRNEPSREILSELGIRTESGTDTAWTFDPGPLERGAQYLRDAGWDGKQKILAMGPINPFWWPVKPSLWKTGARHLLGRYRDTHYKSVYFHSWSEESREQYEDYIDGFAKALNVFVKEENVFPILIGMERLDRKACEDLARKIDVKAPLFISDTYDMYEMVSVLRNVTYLVSSRFHALVTSMPGLVASAGVTMDERIRNLMTERGHEDLMLQVDAIDLGDRLIDVLRTLVRERERIVQEIGQTIPKELVKMGKMGIAFSDEVHRVYPEFPLPERPREWRHFLPSLSTPVEKLLEVYS